MRLTVQAFDSFGTLIPLAAPRPLLPRCDHAGGCLRRDCQTARLLNEAGLAAWMARSPWRSER